MSWNGGIVSTRCQKSLTEWQKKKTFPGCRLWGHNFHFITVPFKTARELGLSLYILITLAPKSDVLLEVGPWLTTDWQAQTRSPDLTEIRWKKITKEEMGGVDNGPSNGGQSNVNQRLLEKHFLVKAREGYIKKIQNSISHLQRIQWTSVHIIQKCACSGRTRESSLVQIF